MTESPKFPYTTVPGKLRALLNKIPDLGRPDKVDKEWLKRVGFAASNDPSILAPLKFVGILDEGGRPTALWEAVRTPTTENKVRLANALRSTYAELFSIYPDAHRKDLEALRNFFRANTSGGEQVQKKIVQTFQILANLADFDSNTEPPTTDEPQEEEISEPAEADRSNVQSAEQASNGRVKIEPSPTFGRAVQSEIVLNVNIELHLPLSTEGEIYDKIFSSMRRHLIDLTDK